MHGRAVPSAGRDLFDEFTAALRGWEWDVALLQEVPPWWPPPSGRARSTPISESCSRRATRLLPLRRAIATRWPDLIKSNGGGANAILVRQVDRIAEHRTRAAVLAGPSAAGCTASGWSRAGCWVCQPPRRRRRRATPGRAGGEHRAAVGGRRAASSSAATSTCARLSLDGYEHAGGHDVDHVFVRDLRPGPARPRRPRARPAVRPRARCAVTLTSRSARQSPRSRATPWRRDPLSNGGSGSYSIPSWIACADLLAGDPRRQRERHVDPRGHAGRGDHLALLDHPRG